MGKEEENEKKKGGRTIPLLTMGRCGGAASVNNKTNAIQCNYWYSHYYTNVNNKTNAIQCNYWYYSHDFLQQYNYS